MAVTNFSQAYSKARKTVTRYKWPGSWEAQLKTKWNIPALMEKDGLNYIHAGGLDSLRKKLSSNPKTSAAESILAAAAGERKGIPGMLGMGSNAECAATIKMLKHLYFEHKRGGQDVWVYSPPKEYDEWVFDEVTGSPVYMRSRLAYEEEVYSANQKRLMCQALQMALRWSKLAMFMTSMPLDSFLSAEPYIKKWFAYSDSSNKDLDKIRKKLLEGYKRIANVCNSHRLVFSDEPIDRNGGGWKDWAFVYSSENIDVIYLQNAFLKASEGNGMWECALTIIHEISHRELKTDDHAYADQNNVKPHRKNFPTKKALTNADTWGFFATDLAGAVPNAKVIEALTGTYA